MADGKLRAARQLSAWLISFLTAELVLPSHMVVACSPARKGLGSWPGVHPKSWIHVTWSHCGPVTFGLNDLLSSLGEGSGEKAYQLSAMSGRIEVRFSCLWSSIWCKTAQCATAPGLGEQRTLSGLLEVNMNQGHVVNQHIRWLSAMGLQDSCILPFGDACSWCVSTLVSWEEAVVSQEHAGSPARLSVHVWDLLKSLAPRA